jgi:hypothetical protein
LPELDSSPLTPIAEVKPRRRNRWIASLAVFVLALLAVGLYLWFVPAGLLQSFGSSPGLDLTVAGAQTIKISWNHSASAIGKATSARLLVDDGDKHREIPLGLDELRLGLVEYQTGHPDGKITLVLEMPGATSLIQSVTWHTRS